jgi:hypothetical protein
VFVHLGIARLNQESPAPSVTAFSYDAGGFLENSSRCMGLSLLSSGPQPVGVRATLRWLQRLGQSVLFRTTGRVVLSVGLSRSPTQSKSRSRPSFRWCASSGSHRHAPPAGNCVASLVIRRTRVGEGWHGACVNRERIPALGLPAPGTYKQVLDLSAIEEADGVPHAVDMIRLLVGGHETVARTSRAVFKVAEAANDPSTCDLLTQRLQVHEKTAGCCAVCSNSEEN